MSPPLGGENAPAARLAFRIPKQESGRLPPLPHHLVQRVEADEYVGHVRKKEVDRAVGRLDAIRAGAAVEDVVADAAKQFVVAGAAFELVIAGAAVEQVGV